MKARHLLIDTILGHAVGAKAEQVILRIGRPPMLVRSGKVADRLSGHVTAETIQTAMSRAGESMEFKYDGQVWRLAASWPGEGVALRFKGRAPSLEETNLREEMLDAILARRPGLVLLVSDPPDRRRYLCQAVLDHAAGQGSIVLSVGEHPGADEVGRILSVSPPARTEERVRIIDQALALSPALVSFPQVRNGNDAGLVLDLVRAGLTVLASLPGRDGGDALCRTADWFRTSIDRLVRDKKIGENEVTRFTPLLPNPA